MPAKKTSATRPPDRDRPGAGARGRHRLRHVLGRQHRACLVPADDRHAQAPGPVGAASTSSATATASRRSTPTLRRGPLPGAGIRPGAGPLLGDGRPPPHDRRAALGDVRQRAGQDRRLPAHPGLAPGRARRSTTPTVGRDQEVPPGLRGRVSTPTSRARTARTISVEYAALGFSNDYRPAEVDPGRLGRLAQGDGLGPARQHAGRDRPFADDQPARRKADRGPVPGATRPTGTSRSSQRARSTPSPSKFDPKRRPERLRADPSHRAAGADSPAAERVGTRAAEREQRSGAVGGRPARRSALALQHPGRDPAAARSERQRYRLQLLGRLRRATRPPASRCWPTTRTWRRSCRRSGTRWACTAGPSPASASTTSPATPSPACPA